MTRAAVAGLRTWTTRRWVTAVVAAGLFGVLVAVPTDLVDTPLFSRAIAPTWWSWPALVLAAVLGGLLAATYVEAARPAETRSRTSGWLGGALTFLAVGCPVCNKLVLLALGTSGALSWFAPLQPMLQALALGLLAWALRTRLRGELTCPLTDPPRASQGAAHV